jgi:hydroxymethylpyrimidine pyrophosphatase-like HAD family hydrolase
LIRVSRVGWGASGIVERVPPAAVDLVVTDLDGTLCDERERVHPRAMEAVAAFEGAGVPVLLATGRRHRMAGIVLRANRLRMSGIYQDGSMGVDAEGSVFHRASFTPAQAQRVLDVFAIAGIEPLAIIDRVDADLVVGARYPGSTRHLERNRGWIAPIDLETALHTERLLTFTITGGDPDLLAPLLAHLAPLASASISPDRMYGGVGLQVRPPGVSKWSGVLAFCARKGIDPERVLAVGDGANDVELLASACIACVMEDGAPEALALAHHRLPPAAAGGWAGVWDLVNGGRGA